MGYGFGYFNLGESFTPRKSAVAYVDKSFKKIDFGNSNAIGKGIL